MIDEDRLSALGSFMSLVAAGDAITFEERMLPLLQSLQVLIPAASASAGVVNLDARRPVPREPLTAASGIGRDKLLRYLGGHVRRDPALPSIRAASGSPTRWSDHLQGTDRPPRSFQRFLEAGGLCHILGWSFRTPDGATLIVSLHRGEDMDDFTEADLVLARVVARALAQVGERAMLGEILRAAVAPGQPLGGVLVSDESGALSVDRGAAALLASAGLKARTELLDRVGRANANSARRRANHDVPIARGPLRARVIPLRPRERTETNCVVVLTRGPLKSDLRANDLGLTPRELELALQVATSRSDDEIAAELDCTYSAVRKGLARVFRKLGLRSRGELIALVSSSARGERESVT